MSAFPQDRRQGDRRRTDRRGAEFRASGSGWNGESFFDPAWLNTGGEAERAPAEGDSALLRIYRSYAAARAALGLALVVAQAASHAVGVGPRTGVTLICMLYAVQAVTLWLLPRFRALIAPRLAPAQRRVQWAATIGVDLAAFGLLHFFASGGSFNYAALLVLPVLMAGVMTQRLLALATAAAVSLLLLATAWHNALEDDTAPALLQSGLAGIGFFVIVVLSAELAGRLAREERAARGSLEMARQQAQLNRLVIEEMADGVLVVDRELRVRAANPAARALLVDAGLAPLAPFSLTLRPAWAQLAEAVRRALDDREWPEAGREVLLVFESEQRRGLRVRVRFMRRGRRWREAGEAADAPVPAQDNTYAVLLLEDVRTAQTRIRQEKLAAMGRVSAGIAHEIRNPLAAIAQANALLLEDEIGPTQQKLARIVAANVERLKRIVDDVLGVVPGDTAAPQAIDADAVVADTVAEWARTAGVAPGGRLHVELPAAPLHVLFDPEHLRRVLVNLLDNAARHASAADGAIVLKLNARAEGPATLSVASDGPTITPEVERYLFEPFFSTRSRGTGLGLYICRELCERYGAHIEYRALPASVAARNQFAVTMRRAPATPAASLPAPTA